MAHGEGTVKLISDPGKPERYEVSVSLGWDPEKGGSEARRRKLDFSIAGPDSRPAVEFPAPAFGSGLRPCPSGTNRPAPALCQKS